MTMSDLVVRTKLARYLALREEASAVKAEMETVKEELKPYLNSARENAAGSKVIDLDSPVQSGGRVYPTLQYTKKVSRSLNEERALEFLMSDQAFEAALDRTPRVDQDGLWDLYINEFIPQEVFDSFFDEKVTWAFTPISD